jgi:hypothetical protein
VAGPVMVMKRALYRGVSCGGAAHGPTSTVVRTPDAMESAVFPPA